MIKSLKELEETSKKLADMAEENLKTLKQLIKKDEEQKELKK